jgi:hypothetical protein
VIGVSAADTFTSALSHTNVEAEALSLPLRDPIAESVRSDAFVLVVELEVDFVLRVISTVRDAALTLTESRTMTEYNAVSESDLSLDTDGEPCDNEKVDKERDAALPLTDGERCDNERVDKERDAALPLTDGERCDNERVDKERDAALPLTDGERCDNEADPVLLLDADPLSVSDRVGEELFENDVLSILDPVIILVEVVRAMDAVNVIALEIETEADGDSLRHRRQIQKEYIMNDVSAAPSFQPMLRPLTNLRPNCSSES